MTFDDAIEAVARDFIKSVMVVDDRASLDAPPEPAPVPAVAIPLKRGMARTEAPPVADDARQEPGLATVGGSDLDGVELTRRFAELGVACSIYKPGKSTESADLLNTASVARHADVVVLDWKLGNTTDEAREILKRIVEEDRKERGRLRLIAVYTSEQNLEVIRDTVQQDLELPDERLAIDAGAPRLTLRSGPLGIVFVSKARGTAPLGTEVNETDLPGVLVKAFARLSHGIVPAVALAAISAVRKSTHHVLARFHAGLDPGLATHRALLKHPEDAEHFVADLVADELKSLIEAARVGSRHSNMPVLEAWVASLAEQGHTFRAPPLSKKGVEKEGAIRLLREGVEAHATLRDSCDPKLGKDGFIKTVPEFFSSSPDAAARTTLELARLSMLKREANSNSWLPEDWLPALTLGTLVAVDGNKQRVLACIQPVCDAVRIKGERSFPFVPLALCDGTKGFSLVLRSSDETDGRYTPENSFHKLEQHSFFADGKTESVLAEKRGNGFWFKNADGRDYEWLADLRQPMAARLSQRWAVQADRIGLDDFEWLRLQTPR